MNIVVNDECKISPAQLDILNKAADRCLEMNIQNYEKYGDRELEVSLSFVALDEIHELNREYRGVDSPTDVLSFPMFESTEEISDALNMETGVVPIGDVVICLDKVVSQAEEYGHTKERETTYLFTHSILHLLGFDHMDDEDRKQMRTAEEAVMKALGLERR